MLNKSTSRSKYVVQSGVTEYPIGFEFQYNGDDTPQIRVTIGDMVAVENLHFIISEDLLTIKLIPLEEEAPVDPNDYFWLEKWVGMPLVIERDIPFVQESDYQLGRISPERIEKDFDLSVMRDQILADKIGEHADEVQVEVDALHSRIDFVQEEHVLDMVAVDEAMATKATKTELENAKAVLSGDIQGNTDAIQKTREDYIQADSEIRQTLDNQASELTTLRDNQASLGNQVSGVEEKIAGKQDKLTAGDNIKIVDNVISATGGGSGDYLPLTGGTLTGPLGFSGESDFGTTGTTLPILRFNVTAPDGSVLEKTISVSPNRFMFFDGLQFHGVRGIYPDTGISCNLGTVDETWKFLFVNKIRNGSGGVLNVPTVGGTLARTEDIDAIGGDGESGQVLTKTDTGMAWTTVSGGDYLPLSGGTLTGPIVIDSIDRPQMRIKNDVYTWEFRVSSSGLHLYKGIGDNTSHLLSFGYSGSIWPTSIFQSLGLSDSPFKKLYVNTLNAGGDGVDLIVPTAGGTIARVEDIDAIGGDGTTGQVLTKTDTGMAWTTVSGGGGGGIADVVHDDTLNGSGTDAAPLGVNTDVIATKDFVYTIDAENVSGMHDYLDDYIWPEINTLKSDKQDKLTAGDGISISGNIISATGTGGTKVIIKRYS